LSGAIVGVADPLGRWAAIAALAVALAPGCAVPPAPSAVVPAPASAASADAASDDVRRTLAPTGSLRIAVYAGSPTSLVRRPGSDEPRGMSVDIGAALASRLSVPWRIVEFERVEQVIEALRGGQADMTITNATGTRAALVDFAEPMVALELGYLVVAGSPIASIADVDRVGVRVGVSQGSSSQATLGKAYRNATLVPASSLKAAAEMLTEHRIEAFATNKGVLHQMADGLPGARVLDGRWGAESLAIAVPKGRDLAKPWLQGFSAWARQQGLIRQAADRAGLRGLAEPEPR